MRLRAITQMQKNRNQPPSVISPIAIDHLKHTEARYSTIDSSQNAPKNLSELFSTHSKFVTQTVTPERKKSVARSKKGDEVYSSIQFGRTATNIIADPSHIL